jgi:hypothetical protein
MVVQRRSEPGETAVPAEHTLPRSSDPATGFRLIRFLRGNVATSGVLADHIESVTVIPSSERKPPAAPDARSHGTSKAVHVIH